jgi:tetrahydromethanopterin S-methyltransferase subunit F
MAKYRTNVFGRNGKLPAGENPAATRVEPVMDLRYE